MNRDLFDTNVAMYVLGYLMNDPQTINKENCLLTLNDFPKPLYQTVFGAINNLANQGATRIYPQDVDLYLGQYNEQYKIFSDGQGLEFLKNLQAMELNDEAQFYVHYEKLKKFTVLRDLEKQNIDTTEFYDSSDIFKLEAESRKLDEITIPQILDRIRLKLAKIEKVNFNKDGNYFQSAADGIFDLLERLKQEPDIGSPLEGKILNYACRGARLGKMYLYSAGSGNGKALPNSTRVPMYDGSWKMVGEVRPGDYLIDKYGKPTKVQATFPQGYKDVYKVTFKDGREALCNDEHLWTVHNVNAKNPLGVETLTLREIINNASANNYQNTKGAWRYSVPVNEPVQYEEKEYKLPPYLLGLLLGDGCFREQSTNRNLTFSDGQEELVKHFQQLGWTYKRNSLNNYTYSFKDEKGQNIHVEEFCYDYDLLPLHNVLTEDKFIPEHYLQGSIEQRLDLLNGLLDTDGCVDTKGRVSFTSINKRLTEDVATLCRSLGYVVSWQEDTRENKYKTGVCYKLAISGRPELKRLLFRMERKHERIEDWYNNGKRKEKFIFNPIVNIEKMDYQEEMTCFLVDNDEHLFLMNDYIVTHNTRFFIDQACYRAYPRIEGEQVVIPSELGKVYYVATEQEPEEIQKMILACVSGVNQSKINNMNLLTPEEEKKIILAARIMEQYRDNFFIDRVPEPSIGKVRTAIIEKILDRDIDMVVYDYIAIPDDDEGMAAKRQLRSDQVLLQFSNTLKEIAVSYNVFMLTGTQITGGDVTKKMVRGFADIRDGKSIADKADFCMIGCFVTDEEYKFIETYCKELGLEQPNYVIDIYKNRDGEMTNCKIYRHFDLGTLRAYDLLATTQSFRLLNNYGEIKYGSQDVVDMVDFLTRGDKEC